MEKRLRAGLIRVASRFPAGHPNRVAILDLLQGRTPKKAVSSETESFVQWVLATKTPMNPGQVQRFLEQKLGRTPTEASDSPASKKKTGPLEKGETVQVNSYKNTNPLNVDACKTYHNRIGFIDDVGSDGVTVAFYKGDSDNPSDIPSGDKQFFSGKTSGKDSGLYRWTSRPQYQERAVEKRIGFELVYFAEKPNLDRRSLEQIQEYVERGMAKGESRDRAYLTGQVGTFAFNKSGEMYFGFMAQQRDRPTSINPSKGQLLYIGVLGQRPSGWVQDWEERLAVDAQKKMLEEAAE